MRERGPVSLVLVVVVGVVIAAKDTTASPAFTDVPHQEPSEGPTSMPVNHVEDTYLDDALDEWLRNFDTYTFMVKQDLGPHEEGDEEDETGGTMENELGGEEEEEAQEEVRDEEWSAPIAVSVGSKSLLDPHLDYLVTVESLVAEEGSIFLTLSKFNNQTGCGVGGLTVEAVMRSLPHRPRGGGGGGGVVGMAEGENGEPHHNSSTTFISFVQNEGNITLPDTSAWAEVSEDYWWARGRLAGGGMLSITFTPPECGCLTLSTYYALPVGNLTLVVGPQAYPDELQILVCMDPHPETPIPDEYEEDEEEDEEVGEYLQEPSALVSPRKEGEAEAEVDAQVTEGDPPVTPRRRKTGRGKKRKEKKTRRRDMRRQRIRQAGRRQARRQQRQQQREEAEGEVEEGEAGFRPGRRRWKQKRKGKKAWKKIKKQGRKARRRFHGGEHLSHHDEGVNGTSSENMTDHHHHHHHHHPHHHLIQGQNASDFLQEERLVDILLSDMATNSTSGEEEEEEEGGAEEEGGEEEEEALTPRQRRKNRRQRKMMLRKERRKAYPPGVKFCCKQGVKHKKNILEFNSTSENSPGPCNSSSELVSNFAHHQFDIEIAACDQTYVKCCTKFTADMWNAIKARKIARRRDRKERRKSRRQDRKYRRKNERRNRKGMNRQSRRQHKAAKEEDAETERDTETQEEGDTAVE